MALRPLHITDFAQVGRRVALVDGAVGFDGEIINVVSRTDPGDTLTIRVEGHDVDADWDNVSAFIVRGVGHTRILNGCRVCVIG